MSSIIFDCEVTEYESLPEKVNDQNCFSINENCLIINLMNSTADLVLSQTEISKKDALELAKLIILKYS